MPRGGKPGNVGNKTRNRNPGGNKSASGSKGNTGGGAPHGNENSTSNAKKAQTLYDAGLALFHGGDYDEALKKFEAVIQLYQGHANALCMTAVVCHGFFVNGIVKKKFDEIADLYKRSITAGCLAAEEDLNLFLLHGPDGDMKLGKYMPASGDVKDILAYRKQRASSDDSADAHYKLAVCVLLCADKDTLSEALVQAEEKLRIAVSRDTDSVVINVTLAAVLGQAGKIDDAIASFGAVLILRPGYNYAKEALANLLSNRVNF
jgi:tetratricopeptide (TPR) repeat protein